jgi:proline iminopeptidase
VYLIGGPSMEIKEGYLSFRDYKTYYRIVNPNGRKTPLLLLHGGPGSTHNSFELLDHVAWDDDRPIVMYDQLGCGLSSDADISFYNKDIWVEELQNLRRQLSLDFRPFLGWNAGNHLFM